MPNVSYSNRKDYLQLHGLTDATNETKIIDKDSFDTIFNKDIDLQGGIIYYEITAFAEFGNDVEYLKGFILVDKVFGANGFKNVIEINDSITANKLSVDVVNGSLFHITLANADTSFAYQCSVSLKFNLLKES